MVFETMRKKIQHIFFVILITSFCNQSIADISKGFSELAKKSMPSVVNISATKVVETRGGNPFPFQVPPGSPFEEFLKIKTKDRNKEEQ